MSLTAAKKEDRVWASVSFEFRLRLVSTSIPNVYTGCIFNTPYVQCLFSLNILYVYRLSTYCLLSPINHSTYCPLNVSRMSAHSPSFVQGQSKQAGDVQEGWDAVNGELEVITAQLRHWSVSISTNKVSTECPLNTLKSLQNVHVLLGSIQKAFVYWMSIECPLKVHCMSTEHFQMTYSP